MRKLFKFLKPYRGAVLAIFCVLIVQAYCDLSLPTYTSDIVNVGIQQKGIEEKIPYEISGKDLEHLLLFVPAKDAAAVKDAYEESGATYEYDGTVMMLKEEIKNDDGRIQELSEILGRPMLLCAGFDSGSGSAAEMEEQMKKQMQEQTEGQMQEQTEGQMQEQIEAQMPDLSQMGIYDIFGMLEDSQREEIINEVEKHLCRRPWSSSPPQYILRMSMRTWGLI